MNFQEFNKNWIHKLVSKVLEKYYLWPAKDFNLEYIKSKYFNCQVVIDCKIYKKNNNTIYIKHLNYFVYLIVPNLKNVTYAFIKENIISIFLNNIM